MSYYYKYKFISAEPIIARVKLELRSYFDTGAVDDSLFPLYINDCLQKIGLAAYPIYPALLDVKDYTADLPNDFKFVREAWMCSEMSKDYQLPSSVYWQTRSAVSTTSTRLDDIDFCDDCDECQNPSMIKAIYKTTQTVAFEFKKHYLLKPGNINSSCPRDMYCANLNSTSADSYDINEGKMILTLPSATVYMIYYGDGMDANTDQLIPDNLRIRNFIELYLKQKTFEQLFNQSSDETFRQGELKWKEYKQLADESYILADIEVKKEDTYKIQRAIRQTLRRNRKYEIR